MTIDTHIESLSTDDEQTATIDHDQEFEAEYVTSDSNADFVNSAAAAVATRSLDFPALRDDYTHLWAELGIRRDYRLNRDRARVGRRGGPWQGQGEDSLHLGRRSGS